MISTRAIEKNATLRRRTQDQRRKRLSACGDAFLELSTRSLLGGAKQAARCCAFPPSDPNLSGAATCSPENYTSSPLQSHVEPRLVRAACAETADGPSKSSSRTGTATSRTGQSRRPTGANFHASRAGRRHIHPSSVLRLLKHTQPPRLNFGGCALAERRARSNRRTAETGRGAHRRSKAMTAGAMTPFVGPGAHLR